MDRGETSYVQIIVITVIYIFFFFKLHNVSYLLCRVLYGARSTDQHFENSNSSTCCNNTSVLALAGVEKWAVLLTKVPKRSMRSRCTLRKAGHDTHLGQVL